MNVSSNLASLYHVPCTWFSRLETDDTHIDSAVVGGNAGGPVILAGGALQELALALVALLL